MYKNQDLALAKSWCTLCFYLSGQDKNKECIKKEKLAKLIWIRPQKRQSQNLANSQLHLHFKFVLVKPQTFGSPTLWHPNIRRKTIIRNPHTPLNAPHTTPIRHKRTQKTRPICPPQKRTKRNQRRKRTNKRPPLVSIFTNAFETVRSLPPLFQTNARHRNPSNAHPKFTSLSPWLGTTRSCPIHWIRSLFIRCR